jgi:hypothetical protein
MDLVPGRTLYDLRRGPDAGELAAIVKQAVRVHAVDAHPPCVADPSAITNVVPLAGQLQDLLDTEQRVHVGVVLKELAVLAANLTRGCPDPLPTRTETIAELYSTAAPAPLSAAERAALRVFARAVIAAVHGQLRRPERQRRPGPEEAEEAAGRLRVRDRQHPVQRGDGGGLPPGATPPRSSCSRTRCPSSTSPPAGHRSLTAPP